MAGPVQTYETVHHENDSLTDTPKDSDLHSALTNRYCRFVLHYFGDASEDTASLADLSTSFARENDCDQEEVAVQLHHVALPKLTAVGAVDYDARRKTASYPGHSNLEDRLHTEESESEYAVAVQ